MDISLFSMQTSIHHTTFLYSQKCCLVKMDQLSTDVQFLQTALNHHLVNESSYCHSSADMWTHDDGLVGSCIHSSVDAELMHEAELLTMQIDANRST